MSNTEVNYDPKYLYEELNRLGNEPHEYNRLLSKIIAELRDGGGLIQWDDGIPYIFDPLRLKWMSLSRSPQVASYYGQNQKRRYLKFGEVPSMGEQGWHVPRKAVVTGLWAKSRSVEKWYLELRRNGIPITLASVEINGSFGNSTTLDVDLEENDWIQLFMNGTKVDHPVACVELTWRL